MFDLNSTRTKVLGAAAVIVTASAVVSAIKDRKDLDACIAERSDLDPETEVVDPTI